MEIPLFESQSALADANGNCTVRFFPGTAGTSWHIARMVTSANVDPSTPMNLAVYKNTVSETNRLDGTQSAAQDASETNIDIVATDTVLGVYSGAPVGTRCSLTLTGIKQTGRY